MTKRNFSKCSHLQKISNLELSIAVIFLDLKGICDLSAKHSLHFLEPFSTGHHLIVYCEKLIFKVYTRQASFVGKKRDGLQIPYDKLEDTILSQIKQLSLEFLSAELLDN